MLQKPHGVVSILCKAIFDRNRKDELPELQLEWIDGICKPLYEVKKRKKRNKLLYLLVVLAQ